MNHAHDHHSHAIPKDYNRAFSFGIILNVAFVIAEGAAGFLAGSLALLTDAGHNLSDVVGLLLAWGGYALAARKPSHRFTYGYGRATILGSLLSGMLLLLAVGAIVWEALARLRYPESPAGVVMILVAGLGVLINGITAWLFVSGKDNDLNIRGAFLHMAADAGVSLGVVIGGLLIMATGWLWVDPVLSLMISVVIFLSTWGLLRDSLKLSFDAVPSNIDAEQVKTFLSTLPGVSQVHDLHIWALSTTDTALTAHLVMPEPPANDDFIYTLSQQLETQYHISHTTVQIESGRLDEHCGACE